MHEHPRAHPRVQANIQVRVWTEQGQELQAGRIRNISLGGVFIETPDPQSFGAALDLEFLLPGPTAGAIRCKGFVVWSTKSSPERSPGMRGMGVRLTDIGVQEMRALAEFVGEKLDT